MLDPIIVELWEDYKRAVDIHGYGIESKNVLFEIVNLIPDEGEVKNE